VLDIVVLKDVISKKLFEARKPCIIFRLRMANQSGGLAE